jgi:hypothetical protein
MKTLAIVAGLAIALMFVVTSHAVTAFEANA